MYYGFWKAQIFSKNGSAILQVIIFSGIFAFISAAVTQLLLNNQNSLQELKAKSDVNEIHSMIFMHLLNGDACRYTFSQGVTAKNATVNQVNVRILDSVNSPTPVYQSGTEISNVRIEDIVIRQGNGVDGYFTDTSSPGLTSYFTVRIIYSYLMGTNQRKTMPKDIRIQTRSNSPWNDGDALGVDLATERCVASGNDFTNFGLFTNLITRFGDDTKTNGTVTLGDATNAANLIVRGGLQVRNSDGAGGTMDLPNSSGLNTGVIFVSDISKKERIEKFSFSKSALEKISGYKYKNKQSKANDLGFIAQEVKKVYPELTGRTSTGDLAVDYYGFVPVVMEMNSKLRQQNIEYELHLQEIEGRLNELEEK